MLTTKAQPLPMLIDGLLDSLRNVVPIPFFTENRELDNHVNIHFGVLIGITGELRGKIIFKGDSRIFSSLGEAMFGMPIEGDMLKSFAGEFGNMISGGLCTNVFGKGLTIDITAPAIMEGDSNISGFQSGTQVAVTFAEKGELLISLLVD
jgi:chemotaxis protein CheX